jgi:two-component system sensor histidine kinase HydH
MPSPAVDILPDVSAPRGANADSRLGDLADIIRAYNDVTVKLQQSHESLGREVVRLQGELASTNAQLHRSRRLAALGEMAAGIAHEIRNPLAAIQLYATMLAEDLRDLASLSGEQRQAAGQTAVKIVCAVRGLNAIVTDVLQFAREIQPRRQTVRLAELIQRALDGQRPVIDAAGVRVEPPRVEPADLHADLDPDLLHQALLNLIRNAVEAMAPRPGTLSIAARREGDSVAITVRDSGPGIPPEAIDRIFNPFFTTRDSGTGLGLAIVHRIVDAHGGAITVHNDHGAVFDLVVPVSLTASPKQAQGLDGVVRP